MDYNNILYTLISFLIVGIIFMITLSITFKVLLKKYSVDNTKIKFYGLFLGMNNKQILSFSMISLNYIFLVYCLLSLSEINIIYITFSSLLVIISDLIMNNYPKGLINILYEIISLFTIFISNILYNFIQEQNSIPVVICLVFVIILSVLIYSYVLFKSLNNVIVKDKFIKEEKYGL